MNKQRLYIIIITLAFIAAMLIFGSYQLGAKLGYQKGATNTQVKYYDIPKQEYGDLLDNIKYLVSLKGNVTDIKNKAITITNGSQNLDIKFKDQTVFVKGPNFDQPEKMGEASFADIKIGGKVWLNAYLKEDKNLYSYQVFIYN